MSVLSRSSKVQDRLASRLIAHPRDGLAQGVVPVRGVHLHRAQVAHGELPVIGLLAICPLKYLLARTLKVLFFSVDAYTNTFIVITHTRTGVKGSFDNFFEKLKYLNLLKI